MKKSTLTYQMKKSIEGFVWITLLEMVIILCYFFMFKENYSVIVVGIITTITSVCGVGVFGYMTDWCCYTNFGFCRKKYYKEQTLLCVLRAGIYAVLPSIAYSIFSKEYAIGFIDGTEKKITQYHSISFPELFLSNFLVLLFMGLVILVAYTSVLLSSGQWMDLFLVLMVVAEILYYDMQMQSSLEVRIGIIIMIAVLCLLLYLYGKKRYSPKYVYKKHVVHSE